MSTAIERVPKYGHHPRDLLRALVLSKGRACILEGQYVSAMTLREHGVRGSTDTLRRHRDDLIATGELPPECVRAYGKSRIAAPTVQAVKQESLKAKEDAKPTKEQDENRDPFVKKCVDLYGRDKMRRQFARGK